MSGLNRDDITRMAREAGYSAQLLEIADMFDRAYAAGVAAEREKVAEWMMQRGYATGPGETMDDLLAELDWQIAENWNRAFMNGVKTEREACAEACEDAVGSASMYGRIEDAQWAYRIKNNCQRLIRARGQG